MSVEEYANEIGLDVVTMSYNYWYSPFDLKSIAEIVFSCFC